MPKPPFSFVKAMEGLQKLGGERRILGCLMRQLRIVPQDPEYLETLAVEGFQLMICETLWDSLYPLAPVPWDVNRDELTKPRVQQDPRPPVNLEALKGAEMACWKGLLRLAVKTLHRNTRLVPLRSSTSEVAEWTTALGDTTEDEGKGKDPAAITVPDRGREASGPSLQKGEGLGASGSASLPTCPRRQAQPQPSEAGYVGPPTKEEQERTLPRSFTAEPWNDPRAYSEAFAKVKADVSRTEAKLFAQANVRMWEKSARQLAGTFENAPSFAEMLGKLEEVIVKPVAPAELGKVDEDLFNGAILYCQNVAVEMTPTLVKGDYAVSSRWLDSTSEFFDRACKDFNQRLDTYPNTNRQEDQCDREDSQRLVKRQRQG